MTITLVVVGRVRGDLAEAVAGYEARVDHYWKFEVVEVAAGAPGGRDDADAVMVAEGERILARLPEGAEVAILTRDGKPMSSRELSAWLQDHAVHGSRGVALVIGGAYGIHEAVLKRAGRRISLSAMTLPHEMARLILVEQIYRAGTLVRGEPYHKGP